MVFDRQIPVTDIVFGLILETDKKNYGIRFILILFLHLFYGTKLNQFHVYTKY